MPIFDDLSKKIVKTGQDMVKGTKDFTESTRLNSQISEEQKQISALYFALGKLFYETNGTNAEEPLLDICRQIAGCFERITACENEISRIKGVRRCTACGMEIPQNSAFCSGCGTPAPAPPPEAPKPEGAKAFCQSCGAQLTPGAAFCISCGQKT